MSLISNIGWVATNIRRSEIEGKSILDVGAKCWDITASNFIKDMNPLSYIGVDIEKGECVDVICDAKELLNKFNSNSFDIVFSLEMLEHVDNWKLALKNMMDVLRPGGLLVLTTRSYGYAEHGYPNDFWRFEASDFEKIFSCFQILKLEQDDKDHGVYIKARKTMVYSWDDLEIFSIKHNARIRQ